jgi:DNA end-binding protein Ku
MKALWRGFILLGQLGIPVRLYSATKDPGVKFVQLHDKDSSPVERPLFCAKEHKEINHNEIIRGVEIEPGKYVTFTSQELNNINDEQLKAINVKQFSLPSQIKLAFFEKPYFIAAAKGGEHGYALLRESLSQTGMLAIGSFYFYGNEYIAAIEASEDTVTEV